jgi:polysaccharide export outer membrane protein
MTRYKDYFVNPQVIVDFVRDENKEGISPWGYVTVLGRVKKPGRIAIPATRDLTVSGAIQQAGGLDTSAQLGAIHVTRRAPNGKTVTKDVNLNAIGVGGRVEDDIVLESDDVVYVPESTF